MKKIYTESDLRAAIVVLEQKQISEAQQMKVQFDLIYESVKPVNLIKSTFKEVSSSEDLKDNLINTTIGISAGFISKKLFVGESQSPVQKLLGTALMFVVTNAITKHPKIVKAAADVVINVISGGLKQIKSTK